MAHRIRPLILIATAMTTGVAHSGAYIFSGEGNGVDVVTHATGYTGTGAALTVNVCIVPGSPNASSIVIPVQNTVDRYNLLIPTIANLRTGSDNDLASLDFDFESVLTHELGHCLGLAHPNLATESGLPSNLRDYTKSTDGADNTFDTDDGADNVIGSADDLRDDDVNLHWFFVDENNPFELPTTPESGTFSRDLSDLPTGDLFATNADRTVSTSIFGLPSTEAVMQQGQFNDEDQRSLTADDVASFQHARVGLDRTDGTADDYTVSLTYGGISTSNCDINVSFNDAQTGFAVCQTGGAFLVVGQDVVITSADTFYNTTAVTWFYSSERIPFPVTESITVNSGGMTSTLDGGGNSLIANDTDQEGDGLVMSTSAYFGPDNGNVVLNANGTFTYTHTGGNTDPDRFVYRVCNDDGGGGETNYCSHQLVSVTVNAGNPPVANDDGPGGAFQVDEAMSVTLSAAQLTANDTDTEDGIPSGAVRIAGTTSNGSVQDNGNQTFTFTHNGTETSTASFQYIVQDSDGADSNTATVNLTVNNSNDAPVAVNDGPGGAFQVDEGMTVLLTAAQLKANDTDEEDGTPPGGNVVIAGSTSNGSVQDNGNQTFTFTHDGTETTTASFQYQVQDSDGATSGNTATVNLTVNNSNDDPVANNDGPGGAFQVDEAMSVTLSAAQLTANDTDEEDGTPPGGAVSIAGSTSNGSVQDNGNQTFTFTHDGTETTTASFQYQVQDSDGATSNTATVNLTVNNSNDAPVAVDDGPGGAFQVDEGMTVLLTAAQLKANDTDEEDGTPPGGDVSIAGTTSNGTVMDNGNQTFTFTHNGGENASASFQYQVQDSDGATSGNTATVNLDVNAVNDPPVANNDNAITGTDNNVIIDVLDNDTDVDGNIDATTVSVVNMPTDGSTSINPVSGEITYDPDPMFVGVDSFTYTVQDDGTPLPAQTSNEATVTISVGTPVIAACAPGGRRALVDFPVLIDVSGEFTGGPFTYSQTGLPITLDIDMNTGVISGVPVSGDLAGSPYSVTVTADDGNSTQDLDFLLTIDADPEVIFYSGIESDCVGL